MKKLLVYISVLVLAGLAAVSAEAGTKGNITFTSPAPGSTVGNSFTLKGTYGPGEECGIGPIGIEGYTGGPDSQQLTLDETNKAFSQPVDIRQPLVMHGDDSRNSPAYIKPGRITFVMEAAQGDVECGSSRITLNVQPDGTAARDDSQDRSQATASPVVSPSPSPTIASSDAPAVEVKGSFWDSLAPQWWLLLGVLAGALALGGAELTAHQYRKRHPKR